MTAADLDRLEQLRIASGRGRAFDVYSANLRHNAPDLIALAREALEARERQIKTTGDVTYDFTRGTDAR